MGVQRVYRRIAAGQRAGSRHDTLAEELATEGAGRLLLRVLPDEDVFVALLDVEELQQDVQVVGAVRLGRVGSHGDSWVVGVTAASPGAPPSPNWPTALLPDQGDRAVGLIDDDVDILAADRFEPSALADALGLVVGDPPTPKGQQRGLVVAGSVPALLPVRPAGARVPA